MGAVPGWYSWIVAADRLHTTPMALMRDPEGLYWFHRAEAALEAEHHAREQAERRHKGGGRGYGRR